MRHWGGSATIAVTQIEYPKQIHACIFTYLDGIICNHPYTSRFIWHHVAFLVLVEWRQIYQCLDGTMAIDKLIKLPYKSCTSSNIRTSDDRRPDGGSDLDVVLVKLFGVMVWGAIVFCHETCWNYRIHHDPFDDPFFHGVLSGMYCWLIFEASHCHELKSMTSGCLSDDELPQHSLIAHVMQYAASEITTKLKTFGSGVGCPIKPPVPVRAAELVQLRLRVYSKIVGYFLDAAWATK